MSKFELNEKPDRGGMWFTGTKYIPIVSMTNEHLQNAYNHCQRKELYYVNRSYSFSDLADQLRNEAEKRGVNLKDIGAEFFKNEKLLRSKTSARLIELQEENNKLRHQLKELQNEKAPVDKA